MSRFMQWLTDTTSKTITQGTIIDGINWGNEDDFLGIVLSNACDFENNKLGYIIVAALIPAKETLQETKEYKNYFKDNKSLNVKGKKGLSNFLEGFIHNKNVGRYYFIDPEPIFEGEPLLVDFQRVLSVPFAEDNNFEIFAQLKHPFIEQMMMHFTSYTARIPSDRVSEDKKNEYLSFLSDNML